MRKYLIAILILGLVTIGGRAVAQAADSSASDEQIIQRCRQSQAYLNSTVRRQDLRSRVDRLQAYRYMQQRLDVYVARLEFNNQPEADNLRASTTTLTNAITSFKSSYEAYDSARDEVANLDDCEGNYTEFRARLNAARAQRQQVNADIATLDSILKDTITPQLQTAATEISAAQKESRQ